MIPNVNLSTSSINVDPKDPKAVANKVQSMFMELMIKSMEDSIGAEDGMYGDSSSSEIYRGMFREQLGSALGSQVGGQLEDMLSKGMGSAKKDSASPADLKISPPQSDPLSGSSSAAEGLPVAGIVTSEVGWRKDPFTGATSYHKGKDIAAPLGTPIHAVASGKVVESGVKGEYGNAVVIQTDDGRRMTYGHNSQNFVRVGDRVNRGDEIAAVGATGRATGPHVHFEVSD